MPYEKYSAHTKELAKKYGINLDRVHRTVLIQALRLYLEGEKQAALEIVTGEPMSNFPEPLTGVVTDLRQANGDYDGMPPEEIDALEAWPIILYFNTATKEKKKKTPLKRNVPTGNL
jgi:hypothetical protein